MSNYHYFVTCSPPSIVLDSITLIDLFTKQHYIILARTHSLEFYEYNSYQIESSGIQTTPDFTINLYADIEKIIKWSPNHSGIQFNHLSSPQDTMYEQEGLLLLTENLCLYLVVPNYQTQRLTLINYIDLDDSRGYRTDRKPILSIDPLYRYVCVHIYKMSLQMIRIQPPSVTNPKWKLRQPITLRLPNIHPLDFMFLPPLINPIVRPKTQSTDPLYTDRQYNTVKRMKLNKNVVQSLDLKDTQFNTNTLLTPYSQQSSSSSGQMNPSELTSSFIMLYDTGPIDSLCSSTLTNYSTGYKSISMMNMSTISSMNFDDTHWREQYKRVEKCSELIVSAMGGILIFGTSKITFIQCSNNNFYSTKHSEKTLYTTLPRCHTLESPLYATTLTTSERFWLLGDSIGQIYIICLEIKKESFHSMSTITSSSSSNQPLSFPTVSSISFQFLGQYSPVSCLTTINCQLSDPFHITREDLISLCCDTSSKNGAICFPQCLLGSKTGDSMIIRLHLTETMGLLNEKDIASIVHRFPNLGPIVDVAFQDSHQEGQIQLLLASGYSTTGSLRIVSPGVTVTTLLPIRHKSKSCRLFSFICGTSQHPTALVIIETSPFHTRVSRLSESTENNTLTFEEWENQSISSFLHILYAGNINQSNDIVLVTPYLISVMKSLTFTTISTYNLDSLLLESNPLFKSAEIVTGHQNIILITTGPFFYVLEINKKGTVNVTGYHQIEEDIACAHMLINESLIGIADWNGKIYLFQLSQSIKHITLHLNKKQTHFNLVYSVASPTNPMSPNVPTGLCMTYMKGLSSTHWQPRSFKMSPLVSTIALVIFIGYSNGTILCLRLQKQTNHNGQENIIDHPLNQDIILEDPHDNLHISDTQSISKYLYTLEEKHFSSIGTTSITFEPLQLFTSSTTLPTCSYAVIAICDVPTILFLDPILRCRSTPLGIPSVRSLISIQERILWSFIKYTDIGTVSTHIPNDVCHNDPILKGSDTTGIICWIPLRSTSPYTLNIGKIEGIQKLQIKTIPLGVSPERVVIHQSTGLIVVASVDEAIGTHNRRDGSTGCMMFIDNRTDFLMRYDLSIAEFPSSFISCCLGHDPRELLIIGSVLENKECKGKLRVLSIEKVGDVSRYPPAPLINEHSKYSSNNGILSNLRIHELWSDTLDAVTSLKDVNGMLLVALTNKIKLYALQSEKSSSLDKKCSSPISLQCLSTYSTHCYVHGIDSFQSSVIMGFVSRSVGLYKIMLNTLSPATGDTETASLKEIATDFNPSWTTAVCCTASETTFLVADDWKNIVALSTAEDRNSSSISGVDGTRKHTLKNDSTTISPELRQIGVFHTGESINRLLSIPPVSQSRWRDVPSSNPPRKKSIGNNNDTVMHELKRGIETPSQTFWASSQGALGVILGITKENFARLLMIQNAISGTLESPLNLHHSNYRNYFSAPRRITNTGFIDGDIIERFLDLPNCQQQQIFDVLHQSHADDFSSLELLVKEIEDVHRSHF